MRGCCLRRPLSWLRCRSRYVIPHQFHLTLQVLRCLLEGLCDTETHGLLLVFPFLYTWADGRAVMASCVYPTSQDGAFTTK